MAPLSVYIAAPYPCRAEALALMDALAVRGIACTSRWITDPSETENAEWALNDLDDVQAATVFVALNPAMWETKGSGGRHVELGYALALKKAVYLVGQRSNIFHHHPSVTLVTDLIAALHQA